MVMEFIGAALLFLLGIRVGTLLHKTKDKNIQNKTNEFKNRDEKGEKDENLVKGILERQNIPYKDNFLFKAKLNSSTG